jgi:hypothetical protein
MTEEDKTRIMDVLTIPDAQFSTREEFEQFYQNTLAPFLLNEVDLIVNGIKHKLREIEFYYTCETHPDPFTHCQPLQEQTAIWYFHRTGKSYRSG